MYDVGIDLEGRGFDMRIGFFWLIVGNSGGRF
jgi:hypothetical protein